MRRSELFDKLNSYFGESRISTVISDYVYLNLNSKTAVEAIDSGIELSSIWKAICIEFDIPENFR